MFAHSETEADSDVPFKWYLQCYIEIRVKLTFQGTGSASPAYVASSKVSRTSEDA